MTDEHPDLSTRTSRLYRYLAIVETILTILALAIWIGITFGFL